METLDLPCLFEIGLHLSPRDVLNLYQTSTYFFMIYDDNYFWKLKFKRDFPNECAKSEEWRSEYFLTYEQRFLKRLQDMFNRFDTISGLENKTHVLEETFEYIVENKDVLDLPKNNLIKENCSTSLKELITNNKLYHFSKYCYALFGDKDINIL